MTSQARIDANRRNAMRSTGPRTAEGKARSRLNGLTHGFRSDQLLLPTEDGAAFQDLLATWMDDWRPKSAARRELVERAAVAAWRLRRCVQIETARLSGRLVAALADWDRREESAVDLLVARLDSDPAAALAGLVSTRAGIDRLADLWDGLAGAADEPGGWRDREAHHSRFLRLQGRDPAAEDEETRTVVDASWRLLLGNRPDLAEHDDRAPFDAIAADRVREQVARLARSRVDGLDELWEARPDRSRERARWAETTALMPTAEDMALLRHEGRFDREFRATLNLLCLPELNRPDRIVGDDREARAPSEPIARVGDDSQAVAPTEPIAVATPDAEPGPIAPSEPSAVATPVAEAGPVAPTEPNLTAPSPEGSTVRRPRPSRSGISARSARSSGLRRRPNPTAGRHSPGRRGRIATVRAGSCPSPRSRGPGNGSRPSRHARVPVPRSWPPSPTATAGRSGRSVAPIRPPPLGRRSEVSWTSG